MYHNSIRTAVCLGLGLAAFATAARADEFELTFTGDNASINGDILFNAVANGTPGQYSVASLVSGTITDPSTGSITPFTLDGISTYAGADNILYVPPTSSPGYVDFGGISFSSGTTAFNIGGDFNGGYVLNESINNPSGGPEDSLAAVSVTNLTPAGAPAPLAGAGILSFFGAGGIAMRKRAKRVIGSLLSLRVATA